MKKYKLLIYFTVVCGLGISACSKQDAWLDKKKNLSDIVPTKISDFQALLDNQDVYSFNYPALSNLCTDNYYVTDEQWAGATPLERNAYIWKQDILEGRDDPDWNDTYQKVSVANIVLEGGQKITPTPAEEQSWATVIGSAYFLRAFAFFNLVQLYAPPFDQTTAGDQLGIPLRLSSDIDIKVERASLKQSYQQVLDDLAQALTYLPDEPLYQTRPSRVAAYALLARIYLTMKDYGQAANYAARVLDTQNFLYDFNDFNTSASVSFPAFPNNQEVIFYARSSSFAFLSGSRVRTDTILYRSYADSDLRKGLFYTDTGAGGVHFKGSYAGVSFAHFAGLANNEIYLIAAEAYARLGEMERADFYLKTLLTHRNNHMWQPANYGDQQALITTILEERRKELPFTGNLRWIDLRRLAKDEYAGLTQVRQLNGQLYELPSSDPRYVLQIPDKELRLNPIEQNVR